MDGAMIYMRALGDENELPVQTEIFRGAIPVGDHTLQIAFTLSAPCGLGPTPRAWYELRAARSYRVANGGAQIVIAGETKNVAAPFEQRPRVKWTARGVLPDAENYDGAEGQVVVREACPNDVAR
jgi:hypothetical protein